MPTFPELAAVVGAVRGSGLIEGSRRGVAMVSGGPDSACLVAALAELMPAGSVLAVHLNYGLREGADRDEACARELCERLGVELTVERPEAPGEDGGGRNLQAWARDARYAAAERLRAASGAEWVATGHTRTDLAETFVYRLATSPGARSLLGMPARRGHVVRPMLALDRDEVRAAAEAAGLPFGDDPSNLDPRFARARIRSEVMPVLNELSPAAERNVAATRAELAEDSEALELMADDLLERAGAASGLTAVGVEALGGAHPAVRRRAIRAMAERASGRQVALSAERAARAWTLAHRPEGGEVDLGGGVAIACEAGTIRVKLGEAAAPEPVSLPVPGEARWGRWRVAAELRPGNEPPRGPEVATLDAAALGPELTVRGWREGDRIRPLGLGGTKTLQDLFTDSGVPRSLRRELPVVLAGDEVAWVPGVAIGDRFRVEPGAGAVVLLTASAAGGRIH